jgi:hypothetical protein
MFCVLVAAMRRADPPVQGVLPIVYRIKKLKKRLRPNERIVKPYIDGWIDGRMDR